MAESGIEVKGLDKLNRTIKAKMKVLQGDRRLLSAIGSIFERDIKKIFQEGGDPKWPESGRVKKSGGQTLLLTGRLRNSITHRVEGSGARSKVLIGTNVIYAKTQHFGRGGIPARPFMIIRPAASQRAIDAIDKAFKAAK